MTDISSPMQNSLAAWHPPGTQNAGRDLTAVAREFEAAFLTEMLVAAGAGATPETFGGGVGEDQFSSLLVRAQAERIAARGGLGLTETVLRSLMSQSSPPERGFE